MTACVMLQGTGSDVGKSLLVAGYCRLFARRGLRVRPFKPQNMSNNAAVTVEGGEIGRAQALQARAAGVAPGVDMNPVLIKPESDTGSQVIVHGRVAGHFEARRYWSDRPALLDAVMESYARLCRDADLVIIEGAGSPAEINLRRGDIANMGFANAAGVPVVLVGDIDRGGVIASIVGTRAVLDEADRDRIRGFLINKFRGDPTLFDDGLSAIVERTGWPALGVVPWFRAAHRLPAEDAVDMTGGSASADRFVKVAVPVFGRIANFDDLDPLRLEPAVELAFVAPGRPLPRDADLVVLPGTKATIADLKAFRGEGWDRDLERHVARGGTVIGLCGGFQMLGRRIADPYGVEGRPEAVDGLGFLDVETELRPDKATRTVQGVHLESGAPVEGYEIHAGLTRGAGLVRPLLSLGGQPDGAISPDGRVMGTYLHGLFASDTFRTAFLTRFGVASSFRYDEAVEASLDALADHLEEHTDADALLALAREKSMPVRPGVAS